MKKQTKLRRMLLTTLLLNSWMGMAVADATPGSRATPTAAVAVNDSTFGCIREMNPVRQFYVDNLLGDTAGTLAAANAPNGAIYPPGSVVQLVPTEAMVKRETGFSPATGDWEFFARQWCSWVRR